MSLNFPDEPNDGDIFQGYVYNATRNVWDIKLPSDNNIEDLNNVSLTSPANGQALVYNTTSSNWVNQNQTFNGLTDTSFASPVTGDSLIYDGTSWVNGPRSNNAIINGDFGIWQRGTSFSPTVNQTYLADRWATGFNGTGSTRSVSRQSFSVGELGVFGYGEPEFYLRYQQSVAGSGATFNNVYQLIEDVRTFAGEFVTISFWAKASENMNRTVTIGQVYGSGGSTANYFNAGEFSLTDSWYRFSSTIQIPTLFGKTLGANSFLGIYFDLPVNSTFTIDLWGFQVEASPIATQFKLSGGGSKAAELALCQRYYHIIKSVGTDGMLLNRANTTAQEYYGDFVLPVRPRLESSTIFSYVIVAPSNVLHKPAVRWDTISSISLNYQNQRLWIVLVPGTNDTSSYGLTLHGLNLYMNAEL